jgi:hypothetical protein
MRLTNLVSPSGDKGPRNDVRLKELIFLKPGIIPSIQLAPMHPRYTRLVATMTTVNKDQNLER